MKKNIFVVSPAFNAEKNIELLYESIAAQSFDDWEWHVINDLSNDNTVEKVAQLEYSDDRVNLINNAKKKFALKNIYDCLHDNKPWDNNAIVVIIDADDLLCNEYAFEKVLEKYKDGAQCVWTAHKWNPGGKNISNFLPDNINPYHFPWVSSHMKTFDSNLFPKIPKENFKDQHGNWFKRGYDQALYLPLLFLSEANFYLPEVCYQYNIDSPSISMRQRAKDGEGAQVKTVNLVRSRGFVKESDGTTIKTLWKRK